MPRGPRAAGAGAGARATDVQLFVIVVGGRHPRAAIEVHDVRLIEAETLEGCWPAIIDGWWGRKSSVHIDAWCAIPLEDAPAGPRPRRLWLADVGGYAHGDFAEAHRYLLVSATDSASARRIARRAAGHDDAAHIDALVDVDALVELRASAGRSLPDYPEGVVTLPVTLGYQPRPRERTPADS